MAGVVPIPEFEAGQLLTAQDLNAMTAALEQIYPVCGSVEQWRGGRKYRPFVIAGDCLPYTEGDDTTSAPVAEVYCQTGLGGALLQPAPVENYVEVFFAAMADKKPCGIHAQIDFAEEGPPEGWNLRPVSMACKAAVWQPEENTESDLVTDTHGDTVLGVVNPEPNARGQSHSRPAAWIMPQCPSAVLRDVTTDPVALPNLGSMAILPGPTPQVLASYLGGYYQKDNGELKRQYVQHEFRARLDAAGVLHISAGNCEEDLFVV